MPPPRVASDLIVPMEDTLQVAPMLPVVTSKMPTYKLKYLYDGGCSVCTSVVAMLKSRKGHEDIYFEDIADPKYSPLKNAGISYEDAMETIHVIKADESILTGMPALSALYDQVGLGLVFKLAQLPLFSQAAELIYNLVSKNRLAMSGNMDNLLALGRVNMERNGTGSCTDPDGECRTSPILENTGLTIDDMDKDNKPVLKGSDRDKILGVYVVGRGTGLRAAPIDIQTGEFIDTGGMRPIEARTIGDVAEAVQDMAAYFKWQGNVGISLPGLITREYEPLAPQRTGADAMKLALGGSRASRHDMEIELRDLIQRDTAVMTGAEANGFGELQYGAGRGETGLVMMLTLGIGIGVALFDDGVLVRHVAFSSIWTWKDATWDEHDLPEPESTDEAAWGRWAQRVQHFVMQLEDKYAPGLIIVGGSASASYDKWAPMMTEIKSVVKCGQLGQMAGVKGAAVGASFMLKLRDDLSKVRAAMGNTLGISPQKITRDQLLSVFEGFADFKSGEVKQKDLSRAMKLLGVNLPEENIREMLYDMDEDGSGDVTFDEFYSYWTELFPPESSVSVLHTEMELDQVFEEEMASNRLVVVEIGFTFCRPCKAFEPKYHAMAKKYTDARFLRADGNANADMMHLARDRLGLKSSPTFYFFRRGELVSRHSGASLERFEMNIRRQLLPGEAEYDEEFEWEEI